ncbi:peptide/nickel transport system permease protein [Tistlia consotensis]|uniref:Peptide/nickel transport system permease protein n=1 Tax=Tistlia consotensis USBA 355 TaxID=560819 RepID=A0A1Y6BJU3_9PROT|nr:ABC transporter permease [Tistlia consotensis]SMF04834.1 peptide/nickel transport system permease protein [Tistlia consotensis USBA 355]SNR54828.1 peptide/nickel transport system permease protein [Tistlia consotensis]
MLVFIARRMGQMILVMLGVSVLVFAMLEVNVDNLAVKVLGPYSSQESREIWLQENGFNRPMYERYVDWIGEIATGDLGKSVTLYKGQTVVAVMAPRLLNTAILGGLVMAVMVPIALLLGVLAGMKEGSLLDRFVSTFTIITTSIPEYATGPMLIVFFVYLIPLFPGTAAMSSGWDWSAMVLPVIVLVLYDIGYVARMTRASMAEVMTTHYIRTARLKGLPFGRIIVRHALRNALIAPFTVIMLQLNWLLSGVVVTEAIFAYRGFGKLLLDASLSGDIFIIEACCLVAVFVAVGSQLISDIGYRFLNPRLRFG